MPSSSTTPHYALPQFIGSDIPQWVGDITPAFSKIDTAIYEAAQTGGEDETARDAAAAAQESANTANESAQAAASAAATAQTTAQAAETKAAQALLEVQNVATNLTTLSANVDTLQTNVNRDIQNLTQQSSQFSTQIDSLTSQITQIKSEISTIQTRLSVNDRYRDFLLSLQIGMSCVWKNTAANTIVEGNFSLNLDTFDTTNYTANISFNGCCQLIASQLLMVTFTSCGKFIINNAGLTLTYKTTSGSNNTIRLSKDNAASYSGRQVFVADAAFTSPYVAGLSIVRSGYLPVLTNQ